MLQLLFDEKFDKIVEEPINYWKNINDVPLDIINYIKLTNESRVVYNFETKEYHCSKCLKKLDNNYCSWCLKQYEISESPNSKYIIDIDDNNKSIYYVFDIVNNQIILYLFQVVNYYNNPLCANPYRMTEININSSYLILETGIMDIKTNKIFYFDKYDKDNIDNDFDFYEILENYECYDNFLYTDNLWKLKNTDLYKYTYIWDLEEYFIKKRFTLASLTVYPLHYKQFEYLIKMQLYSLAINAPYKIEYKNNFKETFKVDKKYYNFMKEIDIEWYQLNALRLCPTENKELLNFISTDTFIFEKLVNYVDLNKLFYYFKKQKLEDERIYEYYDYIEACKKIKLNLQDHNILFPKNFINSHDEIISKIITTTNPDIDKKISNLSYVLNLNNYEDDKYIIFPASSVNNLIDESSQMSNCVRDYCVKFSNNESQIFFMRYKNNPNKSLVTIEVKNGKVVQARTKYNGLPSEEIMKILKKWEMQIIPVINEREE